MDSGVKSDPSPAPTVRPATHPRYVDLCRKGQASPGEQNENPQRKHLNVNMMIEAPPASRVFPVPMGQNAQSCGAKYDNRTWLTHLWSRGYFRSVTENFDIWELQALSSYHHSSLSSPFFSL